MPPHLLSECCYDNAISLTRSGFLVVFCAMHVGSASERFFAVVLLTRRGRYALVEFGTEAANALVLRWYCILRMVSFRRTARTPGTRSQRCKFASDTAENKRKTSAGHTQTRHPQRVQRRFGVLPKRAESSAAQNRTRTVFPNRIGC